MNILYLSCHESLEYYELSQLYALGHKIISIGGYNNPKQPIKSPRPAIDVEQEPLAQLVSHIPICAPIKEIPAQVLEWADMFYVMHRPDYLDLMVKYANGNKPIILRTIGQNIAAVERQLFRYTHNSNLHIVRYSPAERNLPYFNEPKAYIRFSCDQSSFNKWDGKLDKGLAVGQSWVARKDYCGTEVLQTIMQALDIDIYGRMNEGTAIFGKPIVELSHAKYLDALARYRYMIIPGTIPASYTLTFMEAMMAGIPCIVFGHKLNKTKTMFCQNTYEAPDLIDQGYDGFVANSHDELIEYAATLLSDETLAKLISARARAKAIKIFSYTSTKPQWQNLLEEIGATVISHAN